MDATQNDISEHAYELAVLDEYGNYGYEEISNYQSHIMVVRFIRTFVPDGIEPEVGEKHNHPNAV